MDDDALEALSAARRLLDVYRERDEAQSDCRVLLRILVDRNREIASLRQHMVWLEAKAKETP